MRNANNWRINLPTERQWEKAARGHDGRRYPWGGDSYQAGYANINEKYEKAGPHYLKTTSAVGMYPHGQSPYGLLDMSGNVWEWCQNKYFNPENIQEKGSQVRVVRGGSCDVTLLSAAAVFRLSDHPGSRNLSNGFRVTVSLSAPVTSAL